MKVALYMRRSTNDELQAESLATQCVILRAYAAEHGHEIVDMYQESASGRTYSGREQFQKLIDDVKRGAVFEAILVRDVSRWGRFENSDEAAFYEFLCLQHNVRVIYVEEQFGPVDSPYSALLKSMKRVLAAEFSREKSRLITRGKVRSVQQGFRPGAKAPFGMKRILVTRTGEYVQDLPQGSHKIVSNLRTKLAPDRENGAALVAHIFSMFVDERMDATAIARQLNSANIPSPMGMRWHTSTIVGILENEAYCGTAAFRNRHKDTESPRLEGAYEPVISGDMFRAAQLRRLATCNNTTTVDRWKELIQDAVRRRGHLDPKIVARFAKDLVTQRLEARPNDSLAEAFEEEIGTIRSEILTLLSDHFEVKRSGSAWLLNGYYPVSFRFSFPLVRSAGPYWRFVIPARSEFEAVICVCLSTEGGVRSADFRVRSSGEASTVKVQRSLHCEQSIEQQVRRAVWNLRRFMVRSESFKQAFETLISNYGDVNVALFKKELGVGRRTVDAYARRLGVEPVTQRQPSAGRQIVTCPGCGRRREMAASRANQRKTAMCHPCSVQRPQPSSKLTVTCVDCGDARSLFPSVAKKVKVPFRCHACAMRAGREKNRMLKVGRREPRRRKLALLRDIACFALGKMRSDGDRYQHPALRRLKENTLPELVWRSTRTGLRYRLRLDCDEAFVATCDALQPSLWTTSSFAETVLDMENWIAEETGKSGERRWKICLSGARGSVAARG